MQEEFINGGGGGGTLFISYCWPRSKKKREYGRRDPSH
jgi:hypothetical protein